jgi:hypothetical protein
MNDGDPSGFEARGVGIAGYPRLTCLSKISAYCEQVDAELFYPFLKGCSWDTVIL